MTRLLVVMGSGETAPTMVKPHRSIFARCADGPAALLDTPYGFQTNASDISARAVSYFAASVGRQVDVVSWRTPPAAVLERERALATLRAASWIFAGPGSPTYALRQWRGGPVPPLLVDRLARGGVVVFASAAALTLGSHTVPVYEIYKAGAEPHWVPGLDLVAAATGLPAVVIPHYNNTEGGHHDTRYCYLGEQRLSTMEASLPADAFILGVDEHTAAVLDLAAGTASVLGNGVLTIRRAGRSRVYPPGSVLDLATLGATGGASPVPAATGAGPGPTAGAPGPQPTAAPGPTAVADGRAGSGSEGGDADGAGGDADGAGGSADDPREPAVDLCLRDAADRLHAGFDRCLAARDVDGCVSAILDLEQVIVDWSTDTNISDEGEHARAVLRGMVVRLGELAVAGARDPRELVGPAVEILVELRARARERRDWAASDWIRDRLGAAGVQLRDTPEGPRWELGPVSK